MLKNFEPHMGNVERAGSRISKLFTQCLNELEKTASASCLTMRDVGIGTGSYDNIYHLKPTKDPNSPKGVYIPRDLNDAFTELKKMIHPRILEEFKKGTLEENSKYCFCLGMWIRTNWGLWEGSRLTRYFNKLEIHHPDDMSQIILDTFWRYLNENPIELETEIIECKKYRESVSISECE
jgi:hypothetical protein